jgi:hypothetical protein
MVSVIVPSETVIVFVAMTADPGVPGSQPVIL